MMVIFFFYFSINVLTMNMLYFCHQQNDRQERIHIWEGKEDKRVQPEIKSCRSSKHLTFGMWHHHRGYVSNFLVRQPHLSTCNHGNLFKSILFLKRKQQKWQCIVSIICFKHLNENQLKRGIECSEAWNCKPRKYMITWFVCTNLSHNLHSKVIDKIRCVLLFSSNILSQ